jgi:hypothetical protein
MTQIKITNTEANKLAFPQLARVVRECLSKTVSPLDFEYEKQVRALLEILLSKIPKPLGPIEQERIATVRRCDKIIDKHEYTVALLKERLARVHAAARQRDTQNNSRLRKEVRAIDKRLSAAETSKNAELAYTCNKKMRNDNSLNRVWRRDNHARLSIVESLTRDCDRMFSVKNEYGNISRTPWRFLPPLSSGEVDKNSLLRAMWDFQQSRSDVVVDVERIDFACDLKPNRIVLGADEFYGYFACVFEDGHGSVAVLLDNPIKGNAAYIFGQDWFTLAKMHKTELLEQYKDKVVRVVHLSDWKSSIRKMLADKRSPPM